MYIGSLGVTGGSHRLWAHRAFEAKLPLRIFLMLSQASAGIVSKYTSHDDDVTLSIPHLILPCNHIPCKILSSRLTVFNNTACFLAQVMFEIMR